MPWELQDFIPSCDLSGGAKSPCVTNTVKLSRHTVLEFSENGGRAFMNRSALMQQFHISEMSSWSNTP